MAYTKILDVISALECARAALQGSWRSIHLYSPVVDPEILGSTSVLDQMREQIKDTPKLEVQLLLPPAQTWMRSNPALVDWISKMPSVVRARTVAREHLPQRPESRHTFIIGDGERLLRITDNDQYRGSYEATAAGESRQLISFFQELWPHAKDDPELRRYHI